MDWIRVDGNLAGHPKVLRLAEVLHVPRATALGYVVGLWCWAVQYAPTGGPVTPAHASVCMRDGIGRAPSAQRVARFYEALVECGFIDQDGILHDWHIYQGAIVEKRERDREHARKSRERRASVARLDAERSATVATHETRRNETRRDDTEEPPSAATQPFPPDGGTAAANGGPEFPPEDPPEEPEANAYPWHPEDERDFGEAEKPHGRWRDYVEVHMAQKTPPPWPRFLPWLKDDVQRRAQREKASNPVDARKVCEADGKGAPHASER